MIEHPYKDIQMKMNIDNLKFNQVTDLDLFGDLSYKPQEIKSILKALENNHSIIKLDLGHQKLDSEAVGLLIKFIDNNKSLEFLGLEQTYINLNSLTALTQALRHNQNIQQISFRFNYLGPKVATEFAKVLADNQVLSSLNIEGNRIGVQGAQEIATVLETNTTLKRIDIWYTDINADAELVNSSFEAMLDKNTSLVHIGGLLKNENVKNYLKRNKEIDKQQTQEELAFELIVVTDEIRSKKAKLVL